MKMIKTILKLHLESKLSSRQISNALSIPKSTVTDYVRRLKSADITLRDLDGVSDEEVYRRLFPESSSGPQRFNKVLPDFTWIHTELKRKSVTRQLLWEEYREEHPDGLAYSQFCNLYREWQKKLDISMRQVHKAGEKMFVDYSGLKGEVIDPETGEIMYVEIFVAALGASGYTYAEASSSQKKHSFILSHVRAFNYFGGVPEIVVPDNIKSAVTRSDRYEPVINETYREMAEHYGTVIIPTRPYKPKDKAKVELSVKLVQQRILARIRQRQFFSIEDLNDAIWDLLDELNDRTIKKLNKSRRELYEQIDKPALKPLPASGYVIREFKLSKVNIDYHVEIEKCLYSVPYQLVHKRVQCRYTSSLVEIYYQNKRVAVHRRLYKIGSYSTNENHMASAHRAYAKWTPSRIIGWAGTIGANTQTLVKTIMENKPHPEMGFRTCIGIINTARKYETQAVELSAEKMLKLRCYRVSHFRSILKHKTYLEMTDPADEEVVPLIHDNIRGANYYA